MFTFAEIFDQILKDEFIFPSTAWSLFHCHCNAGGWACLVIGSSYSTAAGDKLWSEKYRPLLNMGADKKNVVVLGWHVVAHGCQHGGRQKKKNNLGWHGVGHGGRHGSRQKKRIFFCSWLTCCCTWCYVNGPIFFRPKLLYPTCVVMLIWPILFRPEPLYPTCVSSMLCEFIIVAINAP